MSKHTKEQWEYLPATKESLPIVYIPHPIIGATTICTVSMRAEQEANAKLIAAAPALLEVLERLVACPDVNADMLSPETIKAAELARELISKVKGDL